MEQKCLKCGEVLFKKLHLNNLNLEMNSLKKTKALESDGLDYFYRCSKCRAKNVVISTTSQEGTEQLVISHIKE